MILLASDYDGTLKRNGIIDNKNIEAILDFQRKGNQFAIITGRSIAMIQSELKKYRVPFDYVICGNAARVEQIDMSDEMFNDVSDYQQIIQDRQIAMVFIQHQSEELSIQLKNELENKYSKDATFHYNKGAINVSSVQESKETGVKVLSKRLNCEVYTIGDGYNDLPRIAAFQGFSVSNAPEEVKQKAVKVFDCI